MEVGVGPAQAQRALPVPSPRTAAYGTGTAPLRGGRHAGGAPVRGRASPADRLLSVLALLGLLVTALTIAATLVGLRPLVVRSGSMEPTIATGAMVLVRTVPASEVGVGDVVTVARPDGVRVTHRVLEAEPAGDAVRLVLKGDANEDPDPQPVVVREAGLLVADVPHVGRLAAELASARGGFVLGVLCTSAAVLALRHRA